MFLKNLSKEINKTSVILFKRSQKTEELKKGKKLNSVPAVKKWVEKNAKELQVMVPTFRN